MLGLASPHLKAHSHAKQTSAPTTYPLSVVSIGGPLPFAWICNCTSLSKLPNSDFLAHGSLRNLKVYALSCALNGDWAHLGAGPLRVFHRTG